MPNPATDPAELEARQWRNHRLARAPFAPIRHLPAKTWAGTIIGDTFYGDGEAVTTAPRRPRHHAEDGDWRNQARLLEENS